MYSLTWGGNNPSWRLGRDSQRNRWRRLRRPASSGDNLSSKGSYFDKVTSNGKQGSPYDPLRTLRMFGFGLLWYGPYQYFWYNWLDWMMPQKNTFNFLSKVTLNQLALAPVTLAAVFTWNLALTNKTNDIPEKLKRDLVPSMINGEHNSELHTV
eukprot:jgi/Chrzof1/8475/Cz03g12020.t1